MYTDPKDISSLIGSRICHDLISPLGAISNGIELIEMDGQPLGPEIELIAASVAAAKSRIRFFRVAYGSAKPGVTLAKSEISSILTDHFQDTRIRCTWLPENEVPRQAAKIAFLVIQCFESALPYGGSIVVKRSKGQWQLQAEGQKLRRQPDLWARLDEGYIPDTPLSPADVQFGLLAEISRWRQPQLSYDMTEHRIFVSF